jgi:tetratricopeptide (TPR) repeat protein
VSKKKIKNQKSIVKTTERIVTHSSPGKLKKQLCIVIGIFSFLLYIQSVSFNYAYDDISVIQGNRLVKDGVKSIPDILSSDYWYGFTGAKEGAIYRPTSLIMFAIESSLFPDNPMPSHLINVLLYTLTCVLLFILLSRLFQKNLLFPFICTILYAAHPIHTEVVNNIKSRDEILCFLFSISTLLFYLRYYDVKKTSSLVLGSLFFFLALLSKETAVAFLVLIPLTLFVFRETDRRLLIYTGASLAVFAVIYLGLRQSISSGKPLADGIGVMDNFLVNAKNYAEVFASAMDVLLKYVLLLIYPHPLSSDYSYSQLQIKTFSDPLVILSILLFTGATIFSIIMIRKKNQYAYGILFFLVSIFPVSNIPFLFGASMAERFLYIPSFGFCILVTLLLIKLLKVTKIETAGSLNSFFKKYQTLLLITAVIVVAYSVKTFLRSRDWQDNLTLFSAAAKASPNSGRAHYGYGTALFGSALANEGTPTEVANKFEQSKKEYETALSIYPTYPNAFIGLGTYYKNKNDFKNALVNFEMARYYTPQPKPVLYKELGYAYLRDGQFQKSVAVLDSGLALDPENSNVMNFKGSALFGLQKYNEALTVFLRAAEINPNDVDVIRNIGKSYFYLTQYDKAATYFEKCIAMQPNSGENYRLLGLTYQVLGDTQKANSYFGQYEKLKAAGQ